MSKFKSEIRSAVLNDMGSRIEDALDAARKELAGFQGGKQALVTAKAKIEGHMAFVTKDVESGKLDLEQATLIKKYMTQCVHILENLALTAEVQGYQAQGKIMATENLVKVTKTLFDQERAKLAAAEAAEKAEAAAAAGLGDGQLVGVEDASEEDPRRPVPRQVGIHPGNVIADRKEQTEVVVSDADPELDEAVSQAPTAEEVAAMAGGVEGEDAPEAPAAEDPKPKGRGKKKG